MDDELPAHVKYWLNSDRNDCFFNVGSLGSVEQIGSFKIILMGHSEPMCKLLEESEIAEKGEIALPDIEPKNFKDFLKSIYGGTDIVLRHLDFEDCAKLLYIAEKYLVTQVKCDVLAQMAKLLPLSLDDVFVALKNVVCFLDEKLKNSITEVISNETEKIFAHEKFSEISNEALLFIVEQESLNVNELEVFKAVLKWAETKSSSQDGAIVREYISKHLQHIRFRVLNLEEFCLEIIPTGVLTAEEACQICSALAEKKTHNLAYFSNNRKVRTPPKLGNVSTLPLVLSYTIQNINSFENDSHKYSASSNLGEFSWRLLVGRKDGSLRLFLDCHPRFNLKKGESWECKISFELILINQCGMDGIRRFNSKHTFTKVNNDWGYAHFIPWADVIDPSKGFVKNKNVVVMAIVTLD